MNLDVFRGLANNINTKVVLNNAYQNAVLGPALSASPGNS